MSAHGKERRDAPSRTTARWMPHTARSVPSAFTFNSLTAFPHRRTLSDEHRTIPCRRRKKEKVKRQKGGGNHIKLRSGSPPPFLLLPFSFYLLQRRTVTLMLPTFPLMS